MPNSLPGRPHLRMMLLPADPISEARRGARGSAAIRARMATRTETSETRPGTQPETRSATHAEPPVPSIARRRTAHDADRYANAGPDCFWPECG